MTLLDTTDPAPAALEALLVGTDQGLVLLPRRRRDAVLARLRAHHLDTRLAAGVVPETSRLLATRAALLTNRHGRDTLAGQWSKVVGRAERPDRPLGVRIPPARAQVRAAAEQIADLVRMLRADDPLPAATVAAAGLLLTDGGGPVYTRRAGSLADALDRVVAAGRDSAAL